MAGGIAQISIRNYLAVIAYCGIEMRKKKSNFQIKINEKPSNLMQKRIIFGIGRVHLDVP